MSSGHILLLPLGLIGLYGLISLFKKSKGKAGLKLNWTPLEAISVAVFSFFAGQFASVFLLAPIPTAFGWSDSQVNDWLTNDTLGQFSLSIVTSLAIFGLIYLFIKNRGAKLSSIGLKDKPRLNDFYKAIAAYACYFLIYFVVISVVKALVPSLNLEQEQQIGFKNASKDLLPLVFVSLVVLPPILEETIMRGFIYTSLRQGWKKYVAVIVTSVIFASAHLQFGSGAPLLWVAAIDTFILSLFLINLREKTDKLWAPIFLHALKNLLAFLILFVF